MLRSENVVFSSVSGPALLAFLSSRDGSSVTSGFASISSVLRRCFGVLLRQRRRHRSLPLGISRRLSLVRDITKAVTSFGRSAYADIRVGSVVHVSLNRSVLRCLSHCDSFSGRSIPARSRFLRGLSRRTLLSHVPGASGSVKFVGSFVFKCLVSRTLAGGQLPSLSPGRVRRGC